jgi:hypothetical protein
VTSIRVVSRAAALPFELVDAARSDVSGGVAQQQQQQQQQRHDEGNCTATQHTAHSTEQRYCSVKAEGDQQPQQQCS